VARTGLALLGLVGADGGAAAIGGVMVLTGLGVGLVMQVMVLAAQNAAEYRDLGAATSAVAFLRQLGASAGVAVVGALITWRAGRAGSAEAYAEAVPPVLGLLAPLLALACGLALALPARPLRTTAHVEEKT
jgi:hypothetical protein